MRDEIIEQDYLSDKDKWDEVAKKTCGLDVCSERKIYTIGAKK